MKKLFTLIALLAIFTGVNAKTVVDSEIDFSQVTEFKDYLWNNAEAAARITIKDGCLHFESTEATTNNWDCQFSPLPGVTSMEVDVTYMVTLKIKGSPAGTFAAHLGGVNNYSAFNITEDWSEQTVEYTCVDPKGQYSSNDKFLIQCGSYVGEYDIAYIKITHEEKESHPVEWQNMLTNGDAEGEYGEIACVQSKEFGQHLDEEDEPQIHDADIEEMDGNKVFAVHAKAVDPILTWDEDGEQWGQTHKAGDPMPDNAWQNQFWIVLPKALKSGEQYKVTFKYKASRDVNTSTQNHTTPGQYLDGGQLGDVQFTTEWQNFEKQCSASADMQSIAFNLGAEVYTEDIDFYIDDVTVSTMVLDEGYFVAGTNTETGLVEYDFDNAIEFTYDDAESVYVATIGTEGNKDSWVNEVMISTVRGYDKSFKAATLKCPGSKTAKADDWVDYTQVSNSKITLPASGVWTISIDDVEGQMNFVEVEGEQAREVIDIEPNPTVITVNGVEREYKSTETAPEGYEFKTDEEGNIIYGNDWDNQFIIMGNRALKSGEEIVVEFDYSSSIDATVGSQNGGGDYVGQYIHYAGLGNIDFTTEEQHFAETLTVPAEADGMQSWNFNMAVIKDACIYTVKNVVWKLSDNTESLIDQTGSKNFYVKTGAGTQAECLDGISAVVNDKNVSNVTYNIAGQQVSNNYKGIVIKNGNKYLVK